MKRRLLSVVLALALVCSCCIVADYADVSAATAKKGITVNCKGKAKSNTKAVYAKASLSDAVQAVESVSNVIKLPSFEVSNKNYIEVVANENVVVFVNNAETKETRGKIPNVAVGTSYADLDMAVDMQGFDFWDESIIRSYSLYKGEKLYIGSNGLANIVLSYVKMDSISKVVAAYYVGEVGTEILIDLPKGISNEYVDLYTFNSVTQKEGSYGDAGRFHAYPCDGCYTSDTNSTDTSECTVVEVCVAFDYNNMPIYYSFVCDLADYDAAYLSSLKLTTPLCALKNTNVVVGYAKPNTKVTAKVGKKTFSATADGTGLYKINLGNMKLSGKFSIWQGDSQKTALDVTPTAK